MRDDYAAARHASPEDLAALLRDATADLLDGALANPRLDERHLLLVLRSLAVTPTLLRRVGQSVVWMRLERVRAALALHPRSPSSVALGILSRLRWPDLARVASAPGVSAPVRLGAEKILALRRPEMTHGERITLARVAPHGLLRLLGRDPSPLVVRSLLDNPRTAAEDALAIASRPETPRAVLLALLQNARFAARDDLRQALLTHPNTPAAEALRLVRILDRGTLARLAGAHPLHPLLQVAIERRMAEGVVRRPDPI